MNTPSFRSALGSFLFRWRFGLLLTGVLRAAFWVGLVLLAFGVFDFYAGFSDSARRIVFGTFVVVAALGAALALWDAITFMRRDAAATADAALASGRGDVLSALELHRSSQSTTPLANWLRDRAVSGAADELAALPVSRSMPLRTLGRRTVQLLCVAAVFGALALLVPRPFRIIVQRLLDPSADVPPYSPLSFVLGPKPAEVLYGGEILVTGDISGGKLEAPVRVLTRDVSTGRVDESPAFQENAARFSRKLEKVSTPVEVAFAVGRARSGWMPVNVRMQPKVQEVIVTIEPPAYSRQPRREFALGTQDIAALPGSRMTVRVTSNRPLGGGRLRILVPGSNATPEEVAAEKDETHRVRFAWNARGAARLSLEVRDVAGTDSEPVQLEQKLLPDERPQITLRQPAGELLATPDTELPLDAMASDDLGLTRVALVRKLVGYRERSLSQPVSIGERRHEVADKINLAAFGVVPGQTIELSVEAGDTNPNLLGVSVSEPARIHIITREKYAEMLRNQTTLQEFSDRYRALADAMDAARKSVEELEKAAASGDPKKAEEARQKAFEAHKKAAETFGQMAKDFPIFELDSSLAKASADVAERLVENGKQLEGLKEAKPEALADAVPELKKRLGVMQQQMAEEMERGERAIAGAKVMEQAGKFKELLEKQRELVRDMNRAQEQIRRGEVQAAQALPDLGKREREIAAGLREMEAEMEKALDELPNELIKMAKEGDKFLEMFRALEIPPDVDASAKGAETADSKTAGEKAREALEKMEALLKKKNGICEMCNGGGEEPFPWPEDLSQTMQQLMQSLIPRPGQGGPGGKKPGGAGEGSQGGSGDSDSGYSMRGKMPRLPMHGPQRSKFSRNAGPSLGGGRGEGEGKGKPGDGADVGNNQLATKATREGAGEAAAVEAVPESYREAVKRFFSDNEPNKPKP